MKIEELKWVHPCGCGDTSDLRAEAELTGRGAIRVKKVGADYFVQRFWSNGAALSKDADGVPQYEPITESDLAALLA